MLLRYVEFLKKHYPDVQLKFLLPGRGKIEERLSKAGSVEYYSAPVELSFSDRVKRKLGIKSATHDRVMQAVKLAQQFSPDLVYCNTVACSDFIPALKDCVNAPLIWHFHELETGIALTGIDPHNSLHVADIILTNSGTTSEFLNSEYGVEPARTRMVYPSVPSHNRSRSASGNQFVIGSAGTALPTKGAFDFIELASEMQKLDPSANYRFVWIGNFRKHKEDIETEISKYNVGTILQFTGESDSPMDEYSRMNLFVSLSGEESFGLALVEAGSIGIPVAGYADSGEISEIVRQCKGIIVARRHVKDMAVELNRLISLPHELEVMGQASQKHCRTYFDELIVPQWVHVLEEAVRKESVH